MDDAGTGPIAHFFDSLADVFPELAIHQFDFKIRPHYRDQAWNCVDDQAELMFACAQCFLRAFAVRDVTKKSMEDPGLAGWERCYGEFHRELLSVPAQTGNLD